MTLNPASPLAPSASSVFIFAAEILFLLLGLYAQIYRYRRVSNIFSKLQVADRAQAIIKARDAGLTRT